MSPSASPIDFGPGSRQLFTATVSQKVTYGHLRIGDQPLGTPLSCLFSARGVTRTCFHQLTAIYMVGGNQKATKPASLSCFSGAKLLAQNRSSNTVFSTETD